MIYEVKVSSALLEGILTEGNSMDSFAISKGLPEGCRLIHCRMAEPDVLSLAFQKEGKPSNEIIPLDILVVKKKAKT